MKPTDSIHSEEAQLVITADTLVAFMAKQDLLSDEQCEQLAAWIAAREPEALTNAEKHFLLAARSYVLDYAAELNEEVPHA